ncbi:MAG TPA: ABC transporter permease [Bryobacteraceae bacterium]|nr:ABC transporter permease [Bryobacteraceae bacterium]
MFWKKRKHSDFQQEIQSHLEMEADDLAEEGSNPGDAKYQARREFGNVAAAEERFYESQRWLWFEQLWQDIRYGLRMMHHSPGFTFIAVLSLALGIGANTAVFSVVDAILVKTLPVRAPEELRILSWVRSEKEPVGNHSGYNMNDPQTGQPVSGSFSYPIYQLIRDHVSQFSDLVAFVPNQFTVTADGSSDFASGQFVSGNYFTGLGARTLLGRPILEGDDAAGKPRVVVLTYRYWEKRFGLDPTVIGREIAVNQRSVTIAGVLPPAFQGLYPGRALDLFVPMAMDAEVGPEWYSMTQPDNWWVQVFGRLRPGASEQAAAATVRATMAHVIETYEKNAEVPAVLVRPGGRGVAMLRNSVSNSIYVLGGVVSLVLLIACVNLANLLTARSAARSREMAVRLSMGAGVGRLIRQLLTESFLLAGTGGLLGLLLARPMLQVVLRLVSRSQALGVDARLDLRTLTFTAGVSLLTGLIFGSLPAWRATRVNVTPALKDSGAGGKGASPRLRLSGLLVSAQVALSLLLLVGAGLFVRTLLHLSAVDLGFRPENLLTFQTDPSRNGYEGRRLADLYARLLQNIAAIPGVESVGMSQHGLIQGVESDEDVYVAGTTPKSSERHWTQELFCSASFLSTMRIPLLLGRDLTPGDERAAQHVAVVNEQFVSQLLSGKNPLGQTFYFGRLPPTRDAEPIQIVGVVRDAHYTRVRVEPKATAYLPYAQNLKGLHQMTFAIRTALPPLAIASAVHKAVADTDRTIPVAELKTEEQQIAQSLATERMFAALVSAFGGVAALLAAIGLYGVMAYAVTRRTFEIGIRLALGADRASVLWMVLRQSLWMVAAGLLIGIPSALALTGLVRSSLFGIAPTDPVSFAAAALVMAVVGAVAAWLPARRAAHVDPMIALRYE